MNDDLQKPQRMTAWLNITEFGSAFAYSQAELDRSSEMFDSESIPVPLVRHGDGPWELDTDMSEQVERLRREMEAVWSEAKKYVHMQAITVIQTIDDGIPQNLPSAINAAFWGLTSQCDNAQKENALLRAKLAQYERVTGP